MVLRALVVVALVFLTSLSHAKSLKIIIKVPPNTPENEIIYVTGDQPQLCSWQPRCLILAPRLPGTYSATVDLPDSLTSLRLKVTRGSWATEAGNWRGEPLSDFKISLDSQVNEFVFGVVNWIDQGRMGVTGKLRVYRNVVSPQMGNIQDIKVWLPTSYFAEVKKHYPVIYMHDGQNVFDPATTAHQESDWQVDEAMTELTTANMVQEAIVVAIDCDKDRFSEYDYLQRGALYGEFLVKTVKPMIDHDLRTLPGRDSTYLMGSSMGALISFALLWKYPETFSKAAGLSVPAFIHDSMIFKVIRPEGRSHWPIKFYMDHGTSGRDSSYLPSAQEFYRHLLRCGVFVKDIEYQVFEFADHYESDWARRVSIPLSWLLN
jgi:predicted alpha/beta superfamily hydrolase